MPDTVYRNETAGRKMRYKGHYARGDAMAAKRDALGVVQKLYERIFALDWEGMKGCLSDDFMIIHQGMNHPDLPFYNTFYGKDGCVEWINHIFGTVNLHQFDISYFVAEGDIVHTHVREGAIVKQSGASHCIENFQTFKLNGEHKICFCEIISETLPVVRSLHGKQGELYQSKYKAEDIPVSNYSFDNHHNRETAKELVESIKKTQAENVLNLLSDDIVFIINGDEDCVPFAGKFSGKDSVLQFIKLFLPEIKTIRPEYVISENNKADIVFKLSGQSTVTEKEFMHDASFSLQFDENGNVQYLFSQMNTDEIYQAYMRR
jgi:hypothetical protein